MTYFIIAKLFPWQPIDFNVPLEYSFNKSSYISVS